MIVDDNVKLECGSSEAMVPDERLSAPSKTGIFSPQYVDKGRGTRARPVTGSFLISNGVLLR